MKLAEMLNKQRGGPAGETHTLIADERIKDDGRLLDFTGRVHMEVVRRLGKAARPNEEQIAELAAAVADELARSENYPMSRSDQAQVVAFTIYEITGLGPITPVMSDDTVSEVMVNGPNDVYAERKGKLERVPVRFRDADHVFKVIEKIVSALGRRIDESQPMVDARLPDGSRVNAVIPPLALNGPCLTIRKFAADPFTMQDLIRFGTLTADMMRFLELCVLGRINIIIAGGTSSGKTSTLGVLSSYIPVNERIITIEDAAELQLRQPHVVRLETRPPNIEGKGTVTIRDLVRNSLRMRPDRIIVGEVRSGEALDMLQAMNTGHDGSITTGHANSPRDMLSRLETMVLMAGMDLPLRAIREQISSAIELIVHQARFRDGSRRITHICEVLGMEGDVIQTQDIYTFQESGVNSAGRTTGQFVKSGIRPRFAGKLAARGLVIPESLLT
ncbi:MAG: CpaF family protein [Peptococcaceae bacterium]|jgi:pilus assembly protein CpaF|nr:CpaF family protein [Peptococcaceae bacterium]